MEEEFNEIVSATPVIVDRCRALYERSPTSYVDYALDYLYSAKPYIRKSKECIIERVLSDDAIDDLCNGTNLHKRMFIRLRSNIWKVVLSLPEEDIILDDFQSHYERHGDADMIDDIYASAHHDRADIIYIILTCLSMYRMHKSKVHISIRDVCMDILKTYGFRYEIAYNVVMSGIIGFRDIVDSQCLNAIHAHVSMNSGRRTDDLMYIRSVNPKLCKELDI